MPSIQNEDQEQFEGVPRENGVDEEPEAAPLQPVVRPVQKATRRKVKNMPQKTVHKATKRRTNKKTAAPARSVKKVRSFRRGVPWWVWLLFFIGIALVAVGLYLLFRTTPAPVAAGEVAAIVNGKEIPMAQLERQFALLPETYRAFYTKSIVLDQLIDEEIVIQYGQKNGVVVTPEDVTTEVQNTIKDWGVNAQDLETNLAQFNLTIADFESLMERKLLIERSMVLVFKDVAPPTEDALRLYYAENNSSFFTPEQVKVRHILIASQRDNAAVLGKELKGRVEAGEDFCSIVVNYTDDKGGKETCGEYTFGRGMMVPEFENASFTLKPGQVTLIQTQFGYHVLQKLEDLPAGVTPFEDVKTQISETLARAQQVSTYQSWLTAEKGASTIEVLFTEPVAPAK